MNQFHDDHSKKRKFKGVSDVKNYPRIVTRSGSERT